MAKQKRKAPASKPVTQHQLFPAVVALWFGALFGLGSLAVRPGLVEELVIKSRIDLIVPAAAPPLGVTARMLIALCLAALGAMIGAVIGRRLARPKVEARERKRSNLATPAAAPVARYQQADALEVSATPANRRRALAIEEEEAKFVPLDLAPLPGGAPQVLDIAAIKLDLNPAEAQPAAQGETLVAAPEPTQPAPLPMAPSLDWNNAAPVAPPAHVAAQPMPVPAAIARQVEPDAFAAPPAPPAAEIASPFASPAAPPPASDPAILAQSAAHDGRQVFGLAPQAQPDPNPARQIFGAPVIEDHVPKEFVEAHGFKTSVFDVPEPTPLFAQRPAPEQPLAAPEVAPVFSEPVAEPVVAPVEAVIAPVVEPAPAPLAAEPLPSPAGLGMEDLSARLAESMRRRRAARQQQAAAVSAEPPASPAHPPFGFEPAEPLPEAVAPAAPEAPVSEAQTFAPPAPEPQMFEPAPAPALAPAPEPAPFAMPTAFEPAPPAPLAEAAAAAIPAAMRPLDLGGYEEAEAPLDSLLPPRLAFTTEVVAAPQPASPLPAEPAVQPPAPFAAPVAAEESIDPEQETIPEDDYGSLLGLAQTSARGGFVRIDEPEPVSDAVEPVVIFPGQAARPAAPFAVPQDFAATAGDSAPFRRFDAPSAAGQGQPIVANEAGPAMAAEEADQALRAALASLQRMSGAA